MQSQSLPMLVVPQRRWQVVRAMLALNLVALLGMYISGQWDAAEHAKGAVDRFWYPPHFGIYFALLVAALLSLVGLIMLLRGPGLPFDKLRQNAALTLVVVANGLNFSGAPFDAWWHQTFGLDLTVWSPPHLHILIGTVLAPLACAVYFLDNTPVHAALERLRALNRRGALAIVALSMSLLLSSFIFLEYEGGIRSRDVLARPNWTFPVLWSAYLLFMLALFTAATRRIGTATLVTTLYMLARLGILWLDRAILDYRGVSFYPMVVPALAWDLTLALILSRRGGREALSRVAIAGLIVAAVVALSTPLFFGWLHIAPALTVQPWRTAWPGALISGVLAALIGWWSGTAMRRLRPSSDDRSVPVIGSPVPAD